MRIDVHIERVVLEELPMAVPEQHLFLASLEAELTRLLRRRGLSSNVSAASALASLHGGNVRVRLDAGPTQRGVDVAGAVHRAIGRSERTFRPGGVRNE